MAAAIYVPRINNNDDEVKLVELNVAVGDKVVKGQILAQVETDKAVVDVEADANGFVIGVVGTIGEMITVGNALIWLGETADTPVPQSAGGATARAAAESARPTAKALALLQQHGLDAALIPATGERLTVDDVQRYLASGGAAARQAPPPAPARPDALPEISGELKALKSEDRGMLSTVMWHRDVAVPGYIELTYDPAPWDAYAQSFKQHGLLLSPLLPLMAWRLVELAMQTPRLNATIVGNQRFEYTSVNLGFTVQVGDVLYLTVQRDANKLDPLGFVKAMVDLQRRAMAHKLGPLETQGTTIGFSSMARWKVARHIPILSPNTAIMIAHTVNQDGVGVLGATYDHRVVNGSLVASTLRKLSEPPAHEKTASRNP